MSKYSLDLDGAIHLAIVLEYECNIIYSNDTDFGNISIKRVFR